MKAHTALLLALLLLAGCNEGPDSAIVSDDVSVFSLAGTYTLVGFTIRPLGEPPFEAKDVGEFSGRLVLTRSGQFEERRTIFNVTTLVFSPYSVLSGRQLEITVPFLDCVVRLPLTLIDDVLRTFLSARESRRCGDGAEEHLIWHRTD